MRDNLEKTSLDQINRFVMQAHSQSHLIGQDAEEFCRWMSTLKAYNLWDSPHPAIYLSEGYPYDFPFPLVALETCIDHSCDAGLLEGGGLDLAWAMRCFKRYLEEGDPDFVYYLAKLEGSEDKAAWILALAGDRGQGGFEDEEYMLFASPLAAENYLREKGFIFPHGKTPSGNNDVMSDEEIIHLLIRRHEQKGIGSAV